MSRLLKIKKYWYLLDDTADISEGSAVIYSNTTPVFASFVDTNIKACIINHDNTSIVAANDELEKIMASTNENDTTPMLDMSQIEDLILSTYITKIIQGFSPLLPEKKDAYVYILKSEQECLDIMKTWVKELSIKILKYPEYRCAYTIKFDEDSNQKAWLNEKGFANVIRIYND